MNKIYTFTLKGEDYPSEKFNSNLRLFAHMLYESIYNYYDEYNNPLDVNKNIVYNRIHEGILGEGYYFDSDIYDDGLIDYEPFIAGNDTFGFTINEELMSKEIINELVEYVKGLLKLNYDVTVNSFEYVSKDKDEEKNRRKAIRMVFNELGYCITKKCSFIKRLMNYTGIKKRRIV